MVHHPNTSINHKNLQNLDLKRNIYWSNHTKWLFYHFKQRFWCYSWLNNGHPFQNSDVMDNFIHSIWCKRSNCKILRLIFHIFSDNLWQKSWEKLLFEYFWVSTPFSLLAMLRNNEQKLHQAMSWVRNIVDGQRGNFKNTFENSRNILSLIVWNLLKEIKNQVLCFLLQQNEMCFNETDYVTVHSVMNIMTAKDVKMTRKILE